MAERSGPTYASSTEDRLPWLEPVEDDAMEYAVPRGRLVGGVIAALVVIAVVVGGLFWLRQPRPQAASDEVALIPAPAGNYKTRPENPGGMKVAGQGDTAYATSQGAEPNATIDTNAMPETPVRTPTATKLASATPAKPPVASTIPAKPAVAPTVPAKPAATAAAAKPAATAAAAKPAATAAVAKPATKPTTKSTEIAIKTAPPVTKPSSTTVTLPAPAKPAAGGVAIQLGAFSSEAKADAAWKSLSGRFATLAGLTKTIVAAPKDSGTVYRLRASGAGAPAICGKLKVAGESCVVTHD
jgi:hypothetical protein